LGGHNRSIKTPANIAIRVIEVHNPPMKGTYSLKSLLKWAKYDMQQLYHHDISLEKKIIIIILFTVDRHNNNSTVIIYIIAVTAGTGTIIQFDQSER